ncbi:hypothetical protein AVEN_186181-1 [Araneus ventricosus]|uniref:Uncharacterized protein n=1 Tax=Araneus ventricosus TaxID=182803 RepID=A0A4Y2GDI3_ARAVE|nr:hypothetical protein AVEN_186181-1 [Araneus ventricosus]
MASVAKAVKVDLLSLAAEDGLGASSNLGSLELIKMIQSSSDLSSSQQDTFKNILKALTSAKIRKEKEQKEEKERELAATEREKETEFAAKEKEKERKNELLLKKMELEIEAKKVQSTTEERVKSSFDVHRLLIQKFDPKVGDISLYLTLFERQVKRAKVPEELWVSHLIGLLLNDMAQLIASELEEVTGNYEQVKQILLKRYKFSAEMLRQMFYKYSKNADGTWNDFVYELRK